MTTTSSAAVPPDAVAAPHIVSLADAADLPVSLVGGKAHQLGRLVQAGRRVPDGVVITTAAPADAVMLRAGLRAALDGLGGPVAYRSSAVAEDLDHASYAGQYTTVLSVDDLDAGLAALEVCRRSAHGAEAAAYRAGQGDDDDRMAVIVQRTVPASTAGVAFSANPVTGADEVVIEAVRGLGDQLMDGAITPEQWIVENGAARVAQSIDDHVLDAQIAGAIAAECESIAAESGGPVDIEWAVDGDGLWVLQARPITALPVEPVVDLPKGQTWVRADAYFSEPITPLSYDAWLPIHTASFAHVTEHFGLPFDGIDHRYWYGRVYDRLLPVGGVEKDHPLPPKFVLKLAMRLAPPLRKRLARAAEGAELDLPVAAIDDWENGGRDALRSRFRELLAVDRSALSDRELADHLDDVMAHVLQAAVSHFTLALGGTFILTGQLGLLVEELLGWPPERVLDLVQGHGSASTAAGEAMDELVRAVEADPARRDELVAGFVHDHGHQIVGGDLRAPTWAEDPAPVVRMVESRLGSADRRSGSELQADADAAVAEALAGISAGEDRERFQVALDRARRGRPYGDETESDTLEAVALVRHIALEAGPRLAAGGGLRRADDVHFLMVDELGRALRGDRTAAAEVERREAEYRWALANESPAVIGKPPSGAPTPDVFPAASRPLAGAALWAVALFDMQPVDEALDEAGSGYAGIAASPGKVTGTARIISGPAEFGRLEPGDILVCHHTMAAWSPVFPVVAGLVTEHGGPLSHPGTLAREYGIPAVLSVAHATDRIVDGAIITVDGSKGVVLLDA